MIAVLGAGAFGTALAIALSKQSPVVLWGRDPDLKRTRQSPRLPDHALPPGVGVIGAVGDCKAASVVLLAIPTQELSPFLEMQGAVLPDVPMVACCKGIDLQRSVGPSTLIEQALPGCRVAVLTGPGFASDIAQGLPTALTLACADEALGKSLQHQLSTPVLRLYRSNDVMGAELGGALKNVIAIACGVVTGAGLGTSARAALMTRGFAEIQRVAIALGARPETLQGLSGFGDLTLTCTSEQSRNYRYGVSVGQGAQFDPSQTVEGRATAMAVRALSETTGIEMPICAAVADLATGRIDVTTAVQDLLARPLAAEHP